jgi:hypothetical protein
MNEFENALHDSLGSHFQLISQKYKDIRMEDALHVAAILAANESQSSYLNVLREELNDLKKQVAVMRSIMQKQAKKDNLL